MRKLLLLFVYTSIAYTSEPTKNIHEQFYKKFDKLTKSTVMTINGLSKEIFLDSALELFRKNPYIALIQVEEAANNLFNQGAQPDITKIRKPQAMRAQPNSVCNISQQTLASLTTQKK